MQTSLAIVLPVAALWLAASVVAEQLPRLDRARALRRRTGWLLTLSLAALGTMATVATVAVGTIGTTATDRAAAALAVPAIPATVVALLTIRRLRQLRAGTGAFMSAPGTPAPPRLRAGAAHPMIGLPIQVTALTCGSTLVGASGPMMSLNAGLSGPALSVFALGILGIGVRHALRHSRLAELAAPTTPPSPRAAGVLHV